MSGVFFAGSLVVNDSCLQQQILFLVSSNLVKLESSHTGILPLTVSVLWLSLMDNGRFKGSCFVTLSKVQYIATTEKKMYLTDSKVILHKS